MQEDNSLCHVSTACLCVTSFRGRRNGLIWKAGVSSGSSRGLHAAHCPAGCGAGLAAPAGMSSVSSHL